MFVTQSILVHSEIPIQFSPIEQTNESNVEIEWSFENNNIILVVGFCC